jgi:amphi-Trp domain-containing protein
MNDMEHMQTEHVLRKQAADRLADIAYALVTGGPIEFTINGERLTVPIADGVRLKRALKTENDDVELEIQLSWSNVHSTPLDDLF